LCFKPAPRPRKKIDHGVVEYQKKKEKPGKNPLDPQTKNAKGPGFLGGKQWKKPTGAPQNRGGGFVPHPKRGGKSFYKRDPPNLNKKAGNDKKN